MGKFTIRRDGSNVDASLMLCPVPLAAVLNPSAEEAEEAEEAKRGEEETMETTELAVGRFANGRAALASMSRALGVTSGVTYPAEKTRWISTIGARHTGQPPAPLPPTPIEPPPPAPPAAAQGRPQVEQAAAFAGLRKVHAVQLHSVVITPSPSSPRGCCIACRTARQGWHPHWCPHGVTR